MSKYLIEASALPAGFSYPAPFLRIIAQNLVDLAPWHILDGAAATERARGLRARYPGRHYVPFARRQDNDDLAVWESVTGTDDVLIVHDFASAGSERRKTISFWSWFRCAIDEM